MRFLKSAFWAATAIAALSATADAQSITPETYEATMEVGETITINKTITLSPSGANLVDIFFLADNTGSMGGVINSAKDGASAILGNVPAGADYAFGTGRYNSDPVEGVSLAAAYTETSAISTSTAAAQAGINSWGACVGGCGGDLPEANFVGLSQMAQTADWRTGSQRIAVWFGDARSHTATVSQAQAIADLQAAGVQVIGFNSRGPLSGIDTFGQASAVTSATDGALVHGFTGLSGAEFAAAVNGEISTATSTLDLVFGTTFAGSGLDIEFVCTDPLGCDNVAGGESRTFDVNITALEEGEYDFAVFAEGVSARELDRIVVGGGGVSVPEPGSLLLIGTGLLGIVARRRRGAELVA